LKKLFVATKNQHKLDEIREIFAGSGLEIRSSLDVDGIPDVEETGASFAENSLLKARAIAALVDGIVIADDSGIEVESLDGRPGIYSARYGGDGATNAQQNSLLISELSTKQDRTCNYNCTIAIVYPDGTNDVVEGKVFGEVAKKPSGNNGFGYDPIFYLPQFGKTFGEISSEEKHKISHRGQALRKAQQLIELYQQR
jgi:non-canonical purine NTP pyrophosphatase (RdgB/HAM1 family)